MIADPGNRPQDLLARLRRAGCVFAEDEADLLLDAATSPAELETLVRRRVAGEPLEQVVGWALFCGHRMAVEPGVFVPRRRTEFLVSCAVDLCAPSTIVVDLCCGCGAVGAAISSAATGVELHACDVQAASVDCARRNIGTAGIVHQGDLYDALPAHLRHQVDVLVVNAPYVPSGEIALMPAEARDHEPRIALDGGTDGLDVHRRIAATALDWLAPHGHLLIETSARQAPQTGAILARAGLATRVERSAAFEATVVIGSVRRPW